MAARIRLFISIKSQSVQIRRCNIRRGGRSCLVFENPFFQFGEGVGSCVFQLNGQKLNFEPKIDYQSEFAYSLLWQIFGSGLLPRHWRRCDSTGHQAFSGDRSRPWQKKVFSWPSKIFKTGFDFGCVSWYRRQKFQLPGKLPQNQPELVLGQGAGGQVGRLKVGNEAHHWGLGGPAFKSGRGVLKSRTYGSEVLKSWKTIQVVA